MTAKQAVCEFTRRAGIRGEMYLGFGLLSLRRGNWQIPGMYEAKFRTFCSRQEAREYVKKIASGWIDPTCCEGCHLKTRESVRKAVISELATRYPGTVDYHTEDNRMFCLLDKNHLSR